jgi:hypothetical protein
MSTKLLLTLMLGSALTACACRDVTDEMNDIREKDNDPNIERIQRYLPELRTEATIFYNFNDSTQTILGNEGKTRTPTPSFSRRGFNELKGTEKNELQSIIEKRNSQPSFH